MSDHVDLVDRVYGRRRCAEPVLLDLLGSPAVRRLARIDQSGVGSVVFAAARRVSRLEHSVGVMLLLERFGAGVEEQAAGVLHDAAHTAFSHVVDYAWIGETRTTTRRTGRPPAFAPTASTTPCAT